MDINNKISNGLHLDNNEYDQPPDTMRYNRNGIIMDLGHGNYRWSNLDGTTLVLNLNTTEKILGNCRIRDRFFIIVLNTSDDSVNLYELTYDIDGNLTEDLKWTGANTDLNLSLEFPIRVMLGYYENENIQRIYFSDFHNPPRTINVGSGDSVSINSKFIDLIPKMSPVYGNFRFKSVNNGGNCLAGTYFFTWRLFKEGYYTDWSYLSNPVQVSNGNVIPTFNGYQNLQGGAPNINTRKKIIITISELDTDYDSIQVAAFYSNDYNSASSGVIFYDGDNSSESQDFTFVGNENLGTVTINELMETTIVVERVKDMTHINKRIVLSNLKEREEIDLSTVHSEGRNDQMEVQMTVINREILLDSRGYSFYSGFAMGTDKSLSGVMSMANENLRGIIPGLWYQAIGSVYIDYNGTEYEYLDSQVFQSPSPILVPAANITGHFRAVIVKRKYTAPNVLPDINYSVLDIYSVENAFYNYKNPLFTNVLKGYPAGETVRFGIVFYDLTGRPFFARHLINKSPTGDFTFPKRSDAGSHTQRVYDPVTTADGTYYKYTNGVVLGVKFDSIDITDIKDQIGGFSIVRAPIVRTILAYGVLDQLLIDQDSPNDIHLKPGFNSSPLADADMYDVGYAFHCPEDVFEMTGFSIEKGDRLVNSYYLDADVQAEEEIVDFLGYGRREINTLGTSPHRYNLYQKFRTDTALSIVSSNGAIGVEHEISAYTRYKLGDADPNGVVINPSNPDILLVEQSLNTGDNRSFITNMGIVIMDELEGTVVSEQIKGIFNPGVDKPVALVCYVKRANNNPYGGIENSSLSNTTYIGTGHYQEVNDTILAEIEDAGRYVFNGIEVFGGDSFVCIFDFMRLMQNYDYADAGINTFNHSVIIPIETRINLDLREGRHIAKDRSYHSVTNPLGLQRKTGNQKWEEFNYNDGYSSENINDFYLPVPYNFNLISNFDTRNRYSQEKSYGELEDSFRKFSALSYIDLATEFGPISNVKGRFGKVIFWQRDAVGYIPIAERALSASAFGAPVNLGTGGIFERHDEIVNMLGNSNQFGLAESSMGFHWYDSIRKVLVTLGYGMELTQDSIVKGLDSYFVNSIPNDMNLFDTPLYDYGIVGGYDIRNKIVLITFIMEGGKHSTVGLDIKTNKFIGFFDFRVRSYFNIKDWLYSVRLGGDDIYQHNTGVPGTFHGTFYKSYFTIIVKDETDAAKIFDTFEYIGSEGSFTKILYENTDQSIEELSSTNRNLKYRNRRWFGNFPKVSRERLVDGYLKITFTYEGTDKIWFNQMKSTVRKMM